MQTLPTTHVVKQGECLSSIAKHYNFASWQTIYSHPQNAALRKKRPNPNVLFPGDSVFIPAKEERNESCSTGKLHRFQVPAAKSLLHILVKSYDGAALAGMAYELKVGRETLTGVTDSMGALREKVPIGCDHGELVLTDLGVRRTLQIGHLDPVEEPNENKPIVSGIQARLNNLGFRAGKVDGILGPKTRSAISRFQETVLGREQPSGEPDDETRETLQQLHGS